MNKIFVALCMVAFLAACDDSSSASAENSEPATLSSAEGQGSSSSTKKLTDSSDSNCEECNDEAISSDSNAESNGSSRSSSSEKNAESSSSEKLSGASSSSAGKAKSSSSSVTLAMPCKTETEDNCEYGELTDDRDGQTYKTVKIGDQWWMAENLNYAYTGVPYKYGSLREGSFTSDSTSWCYDNDPANCDTYGRLYTWAAAMDSVGKWSTNGKGCGYYDTTCSPTYPVRGICPEGWHLPDITEWNALFTAVGGRSTAGMVLKSTSGWYNSSNGSDAFGFSALSAGFGGYSLLFSNEGYSASFWSSTEVSNRYAYDMYLYHSDDGADLGDSDKNKVFSARCLKD